VPGSGTSSVHSLVHPYLLTDWIGAHGPDRRPGPRMLTIPGCGALTAAKILGETAGADRLRSKDAYARHNGTAPLPVWSSNRARHRLNVPGTGSPTPPCTASRSPRPTGISLPAT